MRSYVVRESVWGRERERECARKKMNIGGVQSSTYKQFQLRRRCQDQRWPQGLDSFLSFSALGFFVGCEEGVLVKMCIVEKLDGGWCIGGFQEQVCSPVKEIYFLLLSRCPPRWNLLG